MIVLESESAQTAEAFSCQKFRIDPTPFSFNFAFVVFNDSSKCIAKSINFTNLNLFTFGAPL